MSGDRTAADIAAHRDEGYRAVGRFVVVFSQLVLEMKQVLAWQFYRPGTGQSRFVAELPFAVLTAEPLANTFFAMCRMVKDHDEAELRAANKLRNEVIETIQMRNTVAHGDWFVGYWGHTANDPPVPADPWVTRLMPSRTTEPHQSLEIDLDAESDEMERLTRLVVEYGLCASAETSSNSTIPGASGLARSSNLREGRRRRNASCRDRRFATLTFVKSMEIRTRRTPEKHATVRSNFSSGRALIVGPAGVVSHPAEAHHQYYANGASEDHAFGQPHSNRGA